MHQHAWHSFHPWPAWCQHEVVPAWHRQHRRCTRQHGARPSVQAKANLRIRIFLASPILTSMLRDTHRTCAVYSRQGSRGQAYYSCHSSTPFRRQRDRSDPATSRAPWAGLLLLLAMATAAGLQRSCIQHPAHTPSCLCAREPGP